LRTNAIEFLKQHIGVFEDFSGGRLKQLLDGLRAATFEANEAVAPGDEIHPGFGLLKSIS